MKTLSCKDLGAECAFVASGETNEEAMKKMMDHAKEAHPEKMEQMGKMSEADVNAMMMAKIQG